MTRRAFAVAALVAVILVMGVALSAGCGKKAAPPAADDAAPATPALAVPALGVDSPRAFNYVHGAGARDGERAQAAYKAAGRDWAAVRAAAEAALAKDGNHLDAHMLLARALAQAGAPAAVTPHLVAALAGDWMRWGPSLADDADLAGYLATTDGAALLALNQAIGAEVGRRIAAGIVVLGRRAAFTWPAKSGPQWATTRGEVYAYGIDDKRYLRLTHTDHTVAAFVRSPAGAEIAVIGFDKVDMPAPTASDTPPLLVKTWIQTVDAATWTATSKKASLGKARAMVVHYGPGEQLLATALAADGRWGLGAATTVSIDRTTGKSARAITPTEPGPRAQVGFDEAVVEAPLTGIEALWTGGEAASFVITAGGKSVTVPESGRAPRSSFSVSPGGTRVGFATWADPCAKDGAVPSLYAVDSASGQLRHILTAASRFGSRWLDDSRLIYEDGTGGIRLFDAVAGREVARITDRGGLALHGLSATPGPLCKAAPLAVEIDDGSELPLPPETPEADGASDSAGPATAP